MTKRNVVIRTGWKLPQTTVANSRRKGTQRQRTSNGTQKWSQNSGFRACFSTVPIHHSHTVSPEHVLVPRPDENKSVLGAVLEFNAEQATCLRSAFKTREKYWRQTIQQYRHETENSNEVSEQIRFIPEPILSLYGIKTDTNQDFIA